MQISVDTKFLEAILANATAAARIAAHVDNAIIAGGLNKSINEISRMVAHQLGMPYVPRAARALAQGGEPEFNVATAFDDLRQVIARTDALANAAESLLDEMVWGSGECNRRQLERVAHLVGATLDVAQKSVVLGDKFAVDLATRRSEE